MRSTSLTLAEIARVVLLVLAMVGLFLVGFDLLLSRSGGFGEVVAEAVRWRFLRTLPAAPYLVISFLFLLLPVAYALLTRVIWRLERGIVGHGSDTDVFYLRPESVEPVIAGRLRSNVEGVERVRRCRVRQGPFSPRVLVHAQVRADADLPTLQARIRAEVGRSLRQLIGSENASINVRFSVHEEHHRRTRAADNDTEDFHHDSDGETKGEGT